MTPLIRFLIVNLAGGFAIGVVVGVAFLRSNGIAEPFAGQPLATAMLLWSFGASFGMGAIGTALALLPRE